MADMITFDVLLPVLSTPTDVVKRELTVQLDGAEATVHEVTVNQTSVDGLSGRQGAKVSLNLVDIDDGDLRSQASSLEVTLSDTVPPENPGELSVRITGEVPE